MKRRWMGIFGLVVVMLAGRSVSALEVEGQLAGNGGDSSLATYHFDSGNANFQLTKPDGSPLTALEITHQYGGSFKLFDNGQDIVETRHLKVEGEDLSATYWTNLLYPPKDTVAVDPASGRIKFSEVPGWGQAQAIDADLLYASTVWTPEVALNDSGAGFCVFPIGDGSNERIFAAQFDPVAGWFAAVTIDAGAGNSVSYADLAINNNGQAVCVFRQNDAVASRLYANRYQPGVGWTGAVLIDAGAIMVSAIPQVAMNDSGQIFSAFVQNDGASNKIYANWYTPASGWYGAVTIHAVDETGVCSDPHVTVNNSGQAACVFVQNDGAVERIYANRFVANNGWFGAVTIDANDTYTASHPRVKINDDSRIYCVFAQDEDGDGNQRVYFQEYNGQWKTAPVLIDDWDDSTSCYNPELDMNSSGQAMCAFLRDDGSLLRAMATRYQPGSGWYQAVTIDTGLDDVVPSCNPQIAMNDDGMAASLFIQYLGTYMREYSNVYLPGSGWQGAKIISHEYEQGVFSNYGSLALNSQGKGLAAFFQTTTIGVERVFANRLDNAVPYGTVSVNYHEADPVATATPVPTQSKLEIRGRKIEPLQGEQTTIAFDLAQGGAVSIKVYNLRGELVATLADQYYAAGSYNLAWAAQNAGGSLVSSGVYVVHMKLPFETKTQKVVVIK